MHRKAQLSFRDALTTIALSAVVGSAAMGLVGSITNHGGTLEGALAPFLFFFAMSLVFSIGVGLTVGLIYAFLITKIFNASHCRGWVPLGVAAAVPFVVVPYVVYIAGFSHARDAEKSIALGALIYCASTIGSLIFVFREQGWRSSTYRGPSTDRCSLDS